MEHQKGPKDGRNRENKRRAKESTHRFNISSSVNTQLQTERQNSPKSTAVNQSEQFILCVYPLTHINTEGESTEGTLLRVVHGWEPTGWTVKPSLLHVSFRFGCIYAPGLCGAGLSDVIGKITVFYIQGPPGTLRLRHRCRLIEPVPYVCMELWKANRFPKWNHKYSSLQSGSKNSINALYVTPSNNLASWMLLTGRCWVALTDKGDKAWLR